MREFEKRGKEKRTREGDTPAVQPKKPVLPEGSVLPSAAEIRMVKSERRALERAAEEGLSQSALARWIRRGFQSAERWAPSRPPAKHRIRRFLYDVAADVAQLLLSIP